MKRRLNAQIILALAFALVAAAVLAGGAPSEEPAEPSGPTGAPTNGDSGVVAEDGTAGTAGVRVYLDPETGELRSRPADPVSGAETERRALSPHERLNTYGGDLLQERLEQGGFKVDLRGRFQSAVVATIDPETDELSIDCVSAPVTAEAPDESEAADDR